MTDVTEACQTVIDVKAGTEACLIGMTVMIVIEVGEEVEVEVEVVMIEMDLSVVVQAAITEEMGQAQVITGEETTLILNNAAPEVATTSVTIHAGMIAGPT